MIGIFVNEINLLFDVYNFLKKDDVIFVIDGVFIGNNGIGNIFKKVYMGSIIFLMMSVC